MKTYCNPLELGYERPGDNGRGDPPENNIVYRSLMAFVDPASGKLKLPEKLPAGGGFSREKLEKMFYSVGKPYIEGAFMTKADGVYYLQYANPGTQFNTYCDGVYTSASPLGPFTRQTSNPFSSKPGGFITGAGHGSTVRDRHGNLRHAATMRISVNHDMERRIGLFPAGIDADGVLFCNQNFSDYPTRIPEGSFDPWAIKPEWMLLNYRSAVTASSTAEGSSPALAVNEDIRSWWSAGASEPGEWICCDLGAEKDVRAIQINLADEGLGTHYPDSEYGDDRRVRRIELTPQISEYTVEYSGDGETWTPLESVSAECSNGYYEYADGIRARYVRVTGGRLPYGQALRVSGLRVFGNGGGEKPAPVTAGTLRREGMDCAVSWAPVPNADGYNLRYGVAPDKLYCSWMVYGESRVNISTLAKGQEYWLRVDSFNENGVTEGELIRLPD